MEQEVLDERLAGADHVPAHIPASARKEESRESIILCFWVCPLMLSQVPQFLL